jgi:hypothetical protein
MGYTDNDTGNTPTVRADTDTDSNRSLTIDVTRSVLALRCAPQGSHSMRNHPLFTTVAGIVAIASCGVAPLLAGCGSSNSTVSAPLSSATTPSLETLRSAPTTTTVGNASLTLTAVLFRNLQPVVNTGTASSALSGTVTIAPQSGAVIPAGFTITAAYAVEGNTTGTFTLTTPVVPTTSTVSSVQASIAGGPALPAGTPASVVVAFRDTAGNNYLLQTTNVEVAGIY